MLESIFCNRRCFSYLHLSAHKKLTTGVLIALIKLN